MEPRHRKLRLRKNTLRDLTPQDASAARGGAWELDTKNTENILCSLECTETCTCDDACRTKAFSNCFNTCYDTHCDTVTCYTRCGTCPVNSCYGC